MKIRFVVYITLAFCLVAVSFGLYYKSFYKDFNKVENPLDMFAVGLLPYELYEKQSEFIQERLDVSGFVIAAKCIDTTFFRFNCLSQKVIVERVFRGEGLNIGDKIEIIINSSTVSLSDAYGIGMYGINKGFVSELKPEKTYLIFLNHRLQTHNEKDSIYIIGDFIYTPIYCYEDIKNIPIASLKKDSNIAKYKDIKENEFFLMSEDTIEKMDAFKKALLLKYPLR